MKNKLYADCGLSLSSVHGRRLSILLAFGMMSAIAAPFGFGGRSRSGSADCRAKLAELAVFEHQSATG